jgi:hypothetical protein
LPHRVAAAREVVELDPIGSLIDGDMGDSWELGVENRVRQRNTPRRLAEARWR